MTSDPDGHGPDERDLGWRRAAMLFVLLVLMSVLPAGMLVSVALLVLLGFGGIRTGGAFMASVVAMIVALSGQRDPLWFAERGWALMVGGIFAGVTMLAPRWRLTSRALVSVAGSVGAVGMFSVVRSGGWANIDWALNERLASGLATGLQALEVARDGAPLSPAFLSAVYRTMELQGQVFPAVVALESLLALGVAWWLYVRLVQKRDDGLAPVSRFRFNDHLVWLLIGGLVLLAVAPGEGLRRTGLNLAVFMGALYAARGAGVLLFVNGGASFFSVLFFALGVVFAAPLVVGFTLLLGIVDTWLDLRARVQSAA